MYLIYLLYGMQDQVDRRSCFCPFKRHVESVRNPRRLNSRITSPHIISDGPNSKYDGRGRGGRAFDDDLGGYYSGRRESVYNDSNFVFVDPHVLGGLRLRFLSFLLL
jgi:hypothetical protein